MFSDFDQFQSFQIAKTTVNLLDGQLLEININVFRLMDGHFLHKDPGFRVNHFYMDLDREGTITNFKQKCREKGYSMMTVLPFSVF